MKTTLNRNELKAVNESLKEMQFTSKATQKNTEVTSFDFDKKGLVTATVTFPHIKVFVTLKNETIVSVTL